MAIEVDRKKIERKKEANRIEAELPRWLANEVETEAYLDEDGAWRCCGCGDVVRIEGHGSKIRYYCRLCQEVTDGGGQK